MLVLLTGKYYNYDCSNSGHHDSIMAAQLVGHWFLKASKVADDAVGINWCLVQHELCLCYSCLQFKSLVNVTQCHVCYISMSFTKLANYSLVEDGRILMYTDHSVT